MKNLKNFKDWKYFSHGIFLMRYHPLISSNNLLLDWTLLNDNALVRLQKADQSEARYCVEGPTMWSVGGVYDPQNNNSLLCLDKVTLESMTLRDARCGSCQRQSVSMRCRSPVSLSYMILTTACWSSIAVEPHVMGSENVVTRITVSIILNCFISVELRCNLYSFWDCRPRYISRNYFGLNSSPLELSLWFSWYQNVIFS